MIVVIGATFFFAIQLPGESAWSANNTLGPFWPLLTMIQVREKTSSGSAAVRLCTTHTENLVR